MELVYLWVEEYKNIYKQGFNFSPRFECEYNDITEELTIKANDDYIENFFGDNINVTAIVGKNGSGKSALLEVLTSALSASYKSYVFNFDGITNNFFLIYKYEGDYYSLNKDFTKSNLIIEKMPSFKIKWKMEKIFELYENLIAIILNNELMTRLSFSNPEQLFIGSNQSDINRMQKIISSNFIKNRNDTFSKDTDKFFIPTKIRIKSFYSNPKITNKLSSLFSKASFSIEDINKHIKLLEEDKRNYFKKSGLIWTISINTITELHTFEINKLDEKQLEEIFSLTSDLISIEICNDDKSFKDLSYGEKQLLTNLNFILFYSKKDEYTKPEYERDEDTGEPIESFRMEEINHVCILLDEMELGLHPNWQKKFISYTIDFLKHINKKFHLLITSHSPFILSDLPKENVIFLDTYKKDEDTNQKEGNCKNVTDTTNINPFGANIHTLLSDGFFMEDGLMGEFAKGKINEIKKFYEKVIEEKKKETSDFSLLKIEYEDNQTKFEQIQSIIGEPFLKTIMGNYLDELYLIFSDDNTLIDKELQDIEARKKYLKKLKNVKN